MNHRTHWLALSLVALAWGRVGESQPRPRFRRVPVTTLTPGLVGTPVTVAPAPQGIVIAPVGVPVNACTDTGTQSCGQGACRVTVARCLNGQAVSCQPDMNQRVPETCDGLDNDCDGVADRSVDAMGAVTACSPYAADAEIPLDPLSFLADGKPQITFVDGVVGADLKLEAGPSLFSVSIPVTDGLTLDLKITGATIKGDMVSTADGPAIKNGHLGGVIDAKTADTIRGLEVSQIGLTKENSLLDAVFANLLGPLLALPQTPKTFKYKGCRTPDIDVDGDGLEAFCDTNPDDDKKEVDVCVDGDGTEIKDEVDGAGVVTKHCTEALDAKGKPRFVDGISVELNFETTPFKKLVAPK